MAWKKLQIEMPMCYATFRKFKVDFETAKAKVEDRTVVEEREVLMAALTQNQQLMVVREEAARNRHNFYVKFIGLEGLSTKEIQDQFPLLEPMNGRTLGEVIRAPRGFIIDCKTSEVQQILLKLHGEEIGGEMIKVHTYENKMTTDEIFEFLGNQMQQREEVLGKPDSKNNNNNNGANNKGKGGWRGKDGWYQANPIEQEDTQDQWEDEVLDVFAITDKDKEKSKGGKGKGKGKGENSAPPKVEGPKVVSSPPSSPNLAPPPSMTETPVTWLNQWRNPKEPPLWSPQSQSYGPPPPQQFYQRGPYTQSPNAFSSYTSPWQANNQVPQGQWAQGPPSFGGGRGKGGGEKGGSGKGGKGGPIFPANDNFGKGGKGGFNQNPEGKGGKGGKGKGDPGICRICQQAQKPAEHDYRQCPRAKEFFAMKKTFF